jgi:hypothetical protein
LKDYVILGFEVFMLGSVAAVALYTAVSMVLEQRAVDRENARRRREWIHECETARARGTRPPFPPNVLQCR